MLLLTSVAALALIFPVAAIAGTTFYSPHLTLMHTIASDDTGNLRDPSAMIQDVASGQWHFWVVYMSGATQPGWAGYIHHWSSPSIEGPFTNRGLALNHSADPNSFDHHGMFSPSAIFDPDDGHWYLFYSGTGKNYTETKTSAQLVARAASPDGPWTRLGLVCYPTGAPPAYNSSWNARRCDSGRALKVNGRRMYLTKGVERVALAQEGAYFPRDSSVFAPPYSEWANNPIYRATNPDKKGGGGYENCEFFAGPAAEVAPGATPRLHVLCQYHGAPGGQPHFVAARTADGLHNNPLQWALINDIDTAPALEPTPVYEGGPPGASQTTTRYFIARTESGRKGAGALVVSLFKLDWVSKSSEAS